MLWNLAIHNYKAPNWFSSGLLISLHFSTAWVIAADSKPWKIRSLCVFRCSNICKTHLALTKAQLLTVHKLAIASSSFSLSVSIIMSIIWSSCDPLLLWSSYDLLLPHIEIGNVTVIWPLSSVPFTGTVLVLNTSNVYLLGVTQDNGVWSRFMISPFRMLCLTTKLEFFFWNVSFSSLKKLLRGLHFSFCSFHFSHPNGHIFVDSPSIRRRNSTWKVRRDFIDFEKQLHVEIMTSNQRDDFDVVLTFKIDKISMSSAREFFNFVSTSNWRDCCIAVSILSFPNIFCFESLFWANLV